MIQPDKRPVLIDPPSGWKYGFPKVAWPIPEDTDKWLTENGYPQQEIDSLGENFYVQITPVTDDFLLKLYMIGWEDEFKSKRRQLIKEPLYQKAYDLGREHAITGDDLSHIDIMSNEEIIQLILNL